MTETETNPPRREKKDQNAGLGIGSLFIIAIIVTMCSSKSEVEKLQKDTTELKNQVTEIDRKLDRLLPKDSATPSADVEAPAATADAAAAPSGKP